jgi:hypothetical protein
MALLTATLSDTLSISVESVLVEKNFSTDNIGILDSVLVSKAWGVVLADTVSTSDSISKGFVRWATLLDSLDVTEQLKLSAQYSKVSADALTVGDTIHTWKGSDSILTATLGGTADLLAVLMKKKAAAIPAAIPPRTSTALPRQAPVRIEHNVVIPNPPRNREG